MSDDGKVSDPEVSDLRKVRHERKIIRNRQQSDPGEGGAAPSVRKHRVLHWCGRIGAGILLLLLLLFFCRDFVICQTVEKGGSYFLGVPVTLEDFSSSLTGKIEVKNLWIGNPSGYQEPYAICINLIRLRLKPGSLFSDMIEINEVTVQGMQINFEPGLQKSNLTDLQKNIETQCGTMEEKTPEKEKTGKETAILIRSLDISESKLSLSNSTVGLTQTIAMPPVHMTDIGGKDRPWRDVMSELYGVLLGSISKVSGKFGVALSDGMKKMLSEGGRFLDESGRIIPGSKRFLEGSATVVKDSWSGGEKIFSDSVEGLKNMFKSSDSETK